MQKTITQLPEIKLVGITCRTNNAAEGDPMVAKISPTVQKYFQEGLSEQILHRRTPRTTYCVYTDYESDVTGAYTYFVGEEVTSFEGVKEGLVTLSIPMQQYAKFTNGPEKVPDVCIQAWQKIWAMTPTELGGARGYVADFEVYDARSQDLKNVTLDIYVGIKN